MSGAIVSRPGLNELKAEIFKGAVDSVVLYSLDRYAGNAVGGIILISEWLRRKVRLVVLTNQMDFNGEVGQMIASLLLNIAQLERTRIRERQASGIVAAKANGVRWGGSTPGTRTKADPKRVLALRGRGLSNREIVQALSISERTVIHNTRRYRFDTQSEYKLSERQTLTDTDSWLTE